MQGFGKVALHMAHHLLKEEAHLVVTDIHESALDRARDLGIKGSGSGNNLRGGVRPLFSCALGGVLNGDTIPRLKARVVAGAANNQLLTDEDGEDLHRRGILYAPDYIINAGGIINAASEFGMAYSPDQAREKTERIYDTIGRVIQVSKSEELPTAQAADGWPKTGSPRLKRCEESTGRVSRTELPQIAPPSSLIALAPETVLAWREGNF